MGNFRYISGGLIRLVPIALLAGCGSGISHQGSIVGGGSPAFGSTSTTTGASPVGSGLLATDDSTYALYIQWTGAGGHLDGTMTVDAVQGSAPNETLATSTQAVQAQINGTEADVNLGNEGQVFGTFTGGVLKVNIPQQDGTLQAAIFNPSTPTTFNQAVADIQRNLNSANTSAANAQQLQEQQQAIEKQQQAIDSAAATVEKDLQSLTSDRNALAGALSQLAPAISQEKAQLATTAADEQKVINEARSGVNQDQVCTNSDGVATDADGVDTAGDGVSTAADGVSSAINNAQSDISTTQQDQQALQSAQTALPGYQDGAPGPGTVNQAITSTNSAIATAVNTTNGVIGTANQYQTQAYQDALAAANSDSCATPAQPTPQPTISANS